MQHSMLIPTSNRNVAQECISLQAAQRFAKRDGSELIRVLSAAAGLSGVRAAENFLDSLGSLVPEADVVHAALVDLLQMLEELPSTIDLPATKPGAICDELDNAIRYFGARLTDLAAGLTPD